MSEVVSLQKRKSWFARHKLLTVLGAIVILIIAIAALSGGDEEPTTTTGDDAGASEGEQASDVGEAAGIGDPVRDGKFEFTVNSVECGEAELGDDILSTTAQGQFCMVSLTVENIGDERNPYSVTTNTFSTPRAASSLRTPRHSYTCRRHS